MFETWQAWVTVGTLMLMMIALLTNRVGTDTAIVGAVGVLLITGVLDPYDAASSFAHPAVLMIGALFVVAAGLIETGAMHMIAMPLLGRPKGLAGAQLRMMLPVAGMSAFLNNTPIVAMYLPIIQDWARRMRISPSKLFMPLSFAAILGGACTMIGTSSTVAVVELYAEFARDNPERMARSGLEAPTAAKLFWMITPIGLPTAAMGMIAIVFFSRWLLPERRPAAAEEIDPRRYEVEMEIRSGSPIIGKSIEDAGLRSLPGLYLADIERAGSLLPAVSPEEILREGDRLVFVGVVESVVDLRKIRGLEPATDQVDKVEGPRRDRTLVEAVVSHGSPLTYRRVRDTQFRTVYNAAIIAVHRNGSRISKKIGDIILQPGDVLLLDTHARFVHAYRNSDHFYLVSQIDEARVIRYDRAWIALACLGVMIALLTLPMARILSWVKGATGFEALPNDVPPVAAAFFCAFLMVMTRCTTGTLARKSINWQLMMTIGGALALGRAMTDTGAASTIANGILSQFGAVGPMGLLLIIFIITNVFGQLITNKAAAVLMFPIAISAAEASGYSIEPFVISVIASAACSFMTPIAFPTNLMVFGPGGYRFTDYVRLGLPLTVIAAVVTMLVTPMIYPLRVGSGENQPDTGALSVPAMPEQTSGNGG